MNVVSMTVAHAAIAATTLMPASIVSPPRNNDLDIRYVSAAVGLYYVSAPHTIAVAIGGGGEARYVPKTALAKRLYELRQREIAAGRLVLRDAQEIIDEVRASRL